MPIGPSPSSSGLYAFMCRTNGSTYANVLPEPVSAMPMMSRPDIMAGIV